jgi:hypothetical protein
MTTPNFYEFGSDASGLHFTIEATQVGTGVDFVVHMITGSMNLNAIYWSDSDSKSGENSAHSTSNFGSNYNMNGSGFVVDGGVKLGDIGLGHASPTYLQAGDPDHAPFHVDNLDLSVFSQIGVRATSTTTADPLVTSSIKAIGTLHNVAGDFIDDFNNDHAPLGGYTSVDAPDGWHQVGPNGPPSPGSAQLEVVDEGYIPAFTGTGGNWHNNDWLDTQASPGGIDIARDITAPVGPPAGGADYFQETFSITLGLQDFTNSFGHLKTDSNATLDVKFNGTKIDTINLADFTDASNVVHYNEMKTFTYDIKALGLDHNPTGTEHVELHDTTVQADPSPLVGYVGFAVDHIDMHWLV